MVSVRLSDRIPKVADRGQDLLVVNDNDENDDDDDSDINGDNNDNTYVLPCFI